MTRPSRLIVGALILAAALPSLRTDRAAPSSSRAGSAAFLRVHGEPPRFESSTRQLRFAKDRKLDMRGLSGSELDAARLEAVRAYSAVIEYFPEDREIVAEAAFRAGELSRAGGDREAAMMSFEEAWTTGAGTPFRGRAAIELGRLALWDDPGSALEYFERALLDPDTPQGVRDDAMLWYARTQGEQGRARDARRLLERVARTALDPVDRVQAYDRIAESWIEAGDLEAAAGVLNDSRLELADLLREESESGTRLRDAMEGMRSLERLRDAVKARWNTRSDDRGGRGKPR